MNKFINSLTKGSGKSKEKRAGIIASSTKNKQQNLVNNLNDKINNIDLEIENLTDIAPENTYDLRPDGKGFDPQNWVSRLQELKLDKYTTTLELETALNTYYEWFSDEEPSPVDKTSNHDFT